MLVETRPSDAPSGPTSTRQTPVQFPAGIPAFEEHDQFMLLEDARYEPMAWLQSLVGPEVGFLVAPALEIFADYRPTLNDADLEDLGLAPGQRPHLYCILVVHPEGGAITANLKAPLAINLERGRGRQGILADEHFARRYPVALRKPPGREDDQCSS